MVLIYDEYVDNSMMEPLNLSPHGRSESKADALKLAVWDSQTTMKLIAEMFRPLLFMFRWKEPNIWLQLNNETNAPKFVFRALLTILFM